MAWLLDTNVCISLLNRRSGHEAILQHLEDIEYGDVLISAITLAELHFGIAKSMLKKANVKKVEAFLNRFEAAPFDAAAAAAYGGVRARLERSGKPIGPLDTLIAAHALSLASILVTNNTREFRRVPGLKVEDWTA